MSEERKACPFCGPGYRYGDDGCRHDPIPAAVPEPTLEGKIAELVAGHGAYLDFYGNFVGCMCSADGVVVASQHPAHLAAVLAPLVVERAGRALAMLNAAESCGEDCAVEIAGFRIEPCDTYGKTATTIRAEQAEKDCEELARIVRAGGRP